MIPPDPLTAFPRGTRVILHPHPDRPGIDGWRHRLKDATGTVTGRHVVPNELYVQLDHEAQTFGDHTTWNVGVHTDELETTTGAPDVAA